MSGDHGVGTMITTTKQLSAFRQTAAAIDHFHRKDYECAITLAGAAEGQIKEKSSNHLFRLIRAKFSKDETNLFINWMKHSSGPDRAEISEQECVVTIIRAIQKYVGAYSATHPGFQTFSQWAMDKGYTKKPLAVKAKPAKAK
jgi:hypothetical protein